MKTLFVFLLILPYAALAEDKSDSEFFHNPPTQGSEIETKYISGPAGIRSVDSVDNKYSGYLLDFTYSYGITAHMSIGVNINYGEEKTDTGATQTRKIGMSDPVVKFQADDDFLQYGSDLTLGFGKAKAGTVTADGNRNSGGMSLRPYVGVLSTHDGFNFGGTLEYNYYFDRQLDEAGDPTVSGGNSMGLTGFVEYFYGKGWIGSSYKMMFVSDTKKKVGSTTTDYKGDVPNVWNIYFNLDMGEWVMLLAYQRDYYQSINDTGVAGGSKSDAFVNASVVAGVRYDF